MPPQDAPSPLPVGFLPLTETDPTTIGPFRVVGRIGEGGMGAVYGALDDSGGRIAVKVIHPRFAADPGYREQFAREAELLHRVDAECAPAFFGADPAAPQPWLATEFVQGATLKDHIAEHGVLSGDELTAFAAGTAEALAAVHAAGIVHRDIKPANIILSPAGPRVLDFGIARSADDAGDEEGIYGTPGWIAPERLAGRPATSGTDMFAWGGLVVYAATGRGPFGRGDAAALIERIREAEPDTDGVPDALLPLVRAALDRDPDTRPTAEDAFRTVLESSGVDVADADRVGLRDRLRTLLQGTWRGFGDAGRGAGPWIAAASVLSASSAVAGGGAAAGGAAAAGGMAAGGAAAASGGAASAAGAAVGAGGTIAGMSKATALIVAGATATAVTTGGWVGGRALAGEPILPFGAEETAESQQQEQRPDGQEIEFRGLTLRIPDDWKAQTLEDDFYASVPEDAVTDEWLLLYPGGQPGCENVSLDPGLWETVLTDCRHVKIFGPGGIEYGGPGWGPITEDEASGIYAPSGNPPPCPQDREIHEDPDARDPSGRAELAEPRPVGDREALYREVLVACFGEDAGVDENGVNNWWYYDQRTWFLPDEQIFVVDDSGVEEMDDILAAAEWGKAGEQETQEVGYRNMTLELPGEWEVEAREEEFPVWGSADGRGDVGEWLFIRTDPDGSCAEPDWWGGHYECPHLKILGPTGIAVGYGSGPVDENTPVYPSNQPYGCDPSYDTTAPEPADVLAPRRESLADMGDRKAFYRVWSVSCTDSGEDNVSVDGPTVYYEQRYWLLPESQILIVDNYQTRGLADILEDASFED
ncbi:MAG: serine/threonine-protein kinase [Nocardiopsaceae bacterium]|nr:serine/threonine-protein kinase [Nocardiopsaceae bacterium]